MAAYIDEHKSRFKVGPIFRIVGLRVSHAARLPHVQNTSRQPHAGEA